MQSQYKSQGIKIVDSDTKKKAKKMLKIAAASKMDVDDAKTKRKPLLHGAVMKKKKASVPKQVPAELAADMLIG